MTRTAQLATRNDIFVHLKKILVERFELPESAITPDALFYEGLDIESIDAIDILALLKEHTGGKIDPESFKQVRTVGDMVEAVYKLLNR